jgi:prepilin-type N-terminal cleavage/methylation domain-containing protein
MQIVGKTRFESRLSTTVLKRKCLEVAVDKGLSYSHQASAPHSGCQEVRIKPTAQHGFSLIEITIVLIIIGILSVGALSLLAGANKQRQYADTRRNLETVNAALIQFVSREKRLPCPADGALATGVEVTGCAAMSRGVVPWVTLGLTENDATDGWLNRFTYRVAPELVTANSMNLTECDTAGTLAAVGTGASKSCGACVAPFPCARTPVSSVLPGKGLQVQNIAGVVQADNATTTGAAYVIISHGENASGAYNNSEVFVTGAPPAGTAELNNANNQALKSFYVADDYNANAAPAYFDDIVLYKTVHWVIGQARLDARSH